jgi:methylenetetrahydrofolate reductase (NADPH)
LQRMDRAGKPQAEGMAIAVQTIQSLRKIDGVRGVHIMPINWDGVVPDVVRAADLAPRPDAPAS